VTNPACNSHANLPFSAIYVVLNTATEPCWLLVTSAKPLVAPQDFKGSLKFQRGDRNNDSSVMVGM
jgi:hypothetical protein